MPVTEVEQAFSTLAEKIKLTELQVEEEIKACERQISQLKDRIIELNGKQETLANDRQSISDMFSRYGTTDNGAQPAKV